MPKFQVSVIAHASTVVIVEAKNAIAAMEAAEKQAWKEGEDLLDEIRIETSSVREIK